MLKDLLLGGMSSRLNYYLCAMRWARRRGFTRLANHVSRRLERKHGLFIPARANIAASCRFPHPTGIVLGVGVALGERTVVYQNVTIGAARRGNGAVERYPNVGNDCVIFAGAVLVGDIKIGDGCVIGANAVVTKSFPHNSIIVGAPAMAVNSKK